MVPITKVYDKYQTVIPKEVRNKLDIKKDDTIEWILLENNEVKLNFRKKTNFKDIIGIIETKKPTNALKLKKKAQKGENIDLR
ncbi:AbrB/MazE/SpoVT family DNA-binding domain-containing protein [Methanobrevibacter curvatus]|uniref:Putative regulator PrlF n=1 Tax=Methanobrevibacter curvatus TaxID=49547 RepID=A0A166C8S6_9EURY|nr:AbrB/MazE/SpoVT family DNA-binding domain-containing protein [Methanobrevibacter curvatus]KZX12267.1 putative regulator PrlF [Methanobrevibacter curvatus]